MRSLTEVDIRSQLSPTWSRSVPSRPPCAQEGAWPGPTSAPPQRHAFEAPEDLVRYRRPTGELQAAWAFPELTRLAGTVETWWPAIDGYLRLRVTISQTEGYSRKIKQIRRVPCRLGNQTNYKGRIRLNNAATAA